MGHATIEWVYVGVVISLLTWVGAESWNVERIVEHVPAEAREQPFAGGDRSVAAARTRADSGVQEA